MAASLHSVILSCTEHFQNVLLYERWQKNWNDKSIAENTQCNFCECYKQFEYYIKWNLLQRANDTGYPIEYIVNKYKTQSSINIIEEKMYRKRSIFCI